MPIVDQVLNLAYLITNDIFESQDLAEILTNGTVYDF